MEYKYYLNISKDITSYPDYKELGSRTGGCVTSNRMWKALTKVPQLNLAVFNTGNVVSFVKIMDT